MLSLRSRARSIYVNDPKTTSRRSLRRSLCSDPSCSLRERKQKTKRSRDVASIRYGVYYAVQRTSEPLAVCRGANTRSHCRSAHFALHQVSWFVVSLFCKAGTSGWHPRTTPSSSLLTSSRLETPLQPSMVYKSKTPSCNCHTLSADDLYCCAETIPAVIGFVPFRDQLEYNSIRNLNVHDSRPSEALLSVALPPVLSARDGDAYLSGAAPNSNSVRSSISLVPHSTPSRCVYDEQKCNNAVMPTVHSHRTYDYLQFGAQPDPLPCEAVRW